MYGYIEPPGTVALRTTGPGGPSNQTNLSGEANLG